VRAAFGAENPKLVPALGWNIEQQGGFPLCLAADAQNATWVGTEGKGLWRFDPREKKWTQFTTKDGLGDDSIYALAVDKFNRVWAGHLNHGVSVWNGEKWRNYDLLDGPIGDHIFAIAICPTDGDVWLATELGLARYSVSKKDWDYFTRASGLQSDQIQCLAFDDNGDLYAGTQCDGIAISEAADHYKKWRTVSGPREMPNAAVGQGLPSNLINSISILHPAIPMPGGAHDMKVVVAATPVGIAGMPIIGNANPGDEISVSVNQIWGFMRGADWQTNVNGLSNPPAPLPERAPPGGDQELMEDWATCVQQEDAAGRVWIGYRHRGLEIRSADAGRVESRVTSDDSDALWIRAILVPPNSPPLIAVYDGKIGGLMTLDSSEKTPMEPTGEPRGKAADFPTPAKAPTANTFEPLTKRVAAFKNEFEPGDGVYLGDDWRTGGDWVAHYGGSFAKLCGATASGDRDYEEDSDCSVTINTGPHTKTNRSPTSYIGTPNTNDPAALYDPSLGHRIEAEINDGSYQRDQYPPDWEGPDLWVDVTVPDGVHCLSLYFQNYDAHSGSKNKLRDYDVQLLPGSDDAASVQKAEPIARTRVNDFWGGVYKQFVVCGPSRYIIRIGRDRSFVTKLQGVFVDRVSGDAPDKESLPGFEEVEYEPPVSEVDPGEMEKDETLSAANDLWSALDEALDMRGTMSLQLPLRIWAYRAAVAGKAPKELLAVWRWQIGIWTPADRKEFQKAMAEAFKAYSEEHPEMKSEGGDAQ
jgi:hypothetical protein